MKTTRRSIGAQHHVLGSMGNPDAREALLRLVPLLVQNKDQPWRKLTGQRLRRIFEKWKEEQGSRTPKTHPGVTGLGAQKPITFKAAAPYECTEEASDYVSLCLLLLRSEYPPLIALTETEDIASLLAVAALMEPEMTQFDSLLDIVELFLGATVSRNVRLKRQNTNYLRLIGELVLSRKKEIEKAKNLDGGRPKGAEANRKSAATRREEERKEAMSYFKAYPNAKVAVAAADIAEKLGRKKDTVLKAIAFCKEEALRQLSDQKSRK